MKSISLDASQAALVPTRPSIRSYVAAFVSHCAMGLMFVLLPLLPLIFALLFLRPQFVRHYLATLRKCRVHLAALREGPARHYFSDVAGLVRAVPSTITGSCVQCGNCCMHRRCMFLQAGANDTHLCGIYGSFWRRFSNCGSFPLHQQDIDRYDCPSYFATPSTGGAASSAPEDGSARMIWLQRG